MFHTVQASWNFQKALHLDPLNKEVWDVLFLVSVPILQQSFLIW